MCGCVEMYLCVEWCEHDQKRAVLFPDHLPELNDIPLFRPTGHHKHLRSEVAIDVMCVVFVWIGPL